MEHTGEYLYTVRLTRPELLQEGPTDAEATVLEQHEAYLRQLAEDGVVILAGRTQNLDSTSFGLVIFRAGSAEEAEEIMLNDPGVRGDVMSSELFPYRVAYQSR